MPRFFIHCTTGERRIVDEEGHDLPDARAALEMAYEAAREIVAEKVLEGDVIRADSVEVVDESGTLVGSVPIKDVFRVV